MTGPQPTSAQLRPALQLAMEVAAATTEPLPGRVRNLVRNRRLPVNWPTTMRLVLEEDEAFRHLVASSAGADEQSLGRLAWLWLTRPEGWADQVTALVEAELEEKEASAAALRISELEAELARVRAEAQAAASTCSELSAELEQARRDRARAGEKVEAAAAEVQAATDRSREAAGRAAAAEAALEQERSDHRREVEGLRAELAGLGEQLTRARAAAGASEAAHRQTRDGYRRMEGQVEDLRRAVGSSVERAAAAARLLGDALADAAGLLAGMPSDGRPGGGPASGAGVPPRPGAPGARRPGAGGTPGPGCDPPPAPGPPSGGRSAGRPPGSPGSAGSPVTAGTAALGRPTPPAGRGPGRNRRRPLPLPPAVFEDSPEAASHLVRAPGAHLFVDGYNVTFTSWTGTDLPALRHRLVTALSELAVRVKRQTTVVFDGSHQGGRVAAPPVARPWLRIYFSASTVEADEVIVDGVRALPVEVPVVVATNDRRIRADVTRLGANVLSVEQLLGVLGRQPHSGE